MKILNLMFSKVNGGVEQVFLNYTTALQQQGNEVISVIHPRAAIRKKCTGKLKTIYSFGRKDFIAVHRLKKLIQTENPSCIITHTKRAAILVNKTATQVPKIAVCHDPQSFPELEEVSDFVIAVTKQMYQELKINSTDKKIVPVPNMIHLAEEIKFRELKQFNIPIIGVSARFSKLKGIDVFIEALAVLKSRNIAFKAHIAGDGKEKKQYVKLISKHDLQHAADLLGWVHDTESFYEGLDIFCHPSLKESFGLVVVESMMHSIPMVLTQVSGPMEIIGDTESAIMVPPSDPVSMADGLQRLIEDRNYAQFIAKNAFDRVQHFSIKSIGPILHEVLLKSCQCR